jgi:hypothetical protein
MAHQKDSLIVSLSCAGLFALTAMLSTHELTSHAEPQAPIPDPALPTELPNPHSDLIFRATGARSCRDCHGIDKAGALSPRPIENTLVTTLRGKAKGIHGPGRFADCLRCHAGGSKGVEKY